MQAEITKAKEQNATEHPKLHAQFRTGKCWSKSSQRNGLAIDGVLVIPAKASSRTVRANLGGDLDSLPSILQSCGCSSRRTFPQESTVKRPRHHPASTHSSRTLPR